MEDTLQKYCWKGMLILVWENSFSASENDGKALQNSHNVMWKFSLNKDLIRTEFELWDSTKEW